MFTIMNKFKTPEYNAKNKNRITRFIAEWPSISFYIFTAIKVLFISPSSCDNVAPMDFKSLMIHTTGTVLIFHCVMYECMPDSIISDITHGIVTTVISPQSMSLKISHGVLRTCMSISRRKYPLHIIWVYNVLIISIAYLICLKNYTN